MELRLLTTESERRAFAEALVEVRARRGIGFRETRASRVGDIHLTFGRLYGLFNEKEPEKDDLMAGLIIHDLGTFTQSYPKPDLTHLPPESVFEYGELWARVKGASLPARRGLAILMGLLQAQAVVGYAIAQPWDLTEMYRGIARKVGDLIEWPWAETLEGGKILVQPMLLDGEPLRELVSRAFAAGFETIDSHRVIRFENPFPLRVSSQVEPPRMADGPAQETNGVAPA